MRALEQRLAALEVVTKPERASCVERFTNDGGVNWVRQIETLRGDEMIIEMPDDGGDELPSFRISSLLRAGADKPADLSPSASRYWDTAAWLDANV